MPGTSQFKQLPEAERIICLRVAAARKLKRLSQEELAKEVNFSRNQIANVEAMRVPLKAGLAMALYNQLLVNPSWLARGIGVAVFTDQSWSRLIMGDFDPDMLFSRFFAEKLSRIFEPMDRLISRRSGQAEWWEKEGLSAVASAAKTPESLKLLAKIEKEQKAIVKMVQSTKEIEEEIKQSAGQELLDSGKSLPQSADVQNKFRTFGELLDHLRKITKPHGAKAELARRFKVSRQAVDQWLRGEAKPSAEIAIELQHWMPRLEK